ncbi:MAG TPA: hypothetical protein VFV38_19185 [Ktedonobacteraceae bacterium]|nr:hypothetical protein [Ktedonobacteraceae bacterium]
MVKHTSAQQQKNIVRSTRPITFTCRQCGQKVTEERYPSHTPLYCAACQPEVVKARTRARVAAYRKRQTEHLSAPPTLLFPERSQGYLLVVLRPGRIAVEATSGEGCLQAMKACDDGETVTIRGEHRDQEIGQGTYRKRGVPGHIDTIETLSTTGAMVGLIEIALAHRREEQQKQIRAERAERLIQLACSCDHPVNYDATDQCFALADGQEILVCPVCGKPLDLGQIMRDRQQRIAELQQELQHQQAALRLIQRIPRRIENKTLRRG